MSNVNPKLLSARPRVTQTLQSAQTKPFTAHMMAAIKEAQDKPNKKPKKSVLEQLLALTGQF